LDMMLTTHIWWQALECVLLHLYVICLFSWDGTLIQRKHHHLYTSEWSLISYFTYLVARHISTVTFLLGYGIAQILKTHVHNQ
jgi:hypothetical protein